MEAEQVRKRVGQLGRAAKGDLVLVGGAGGFVGLDFVVLSHDPKVTQAGDLRQAPLPACG
jgi:hypothetical protein